MCQQIQQIAFITFLARWRFMTEKLLAGSCETRVIVYGQITFVNSL